MKKTIQIGARTVGRGHPAYVIAEIGSNHDCDIGRAKELVKASKYAGADAVKFQSFSPDGLVNRLVLNEGGNWVENPAYPVIERLTLPDAWHAELKDCCDEAGMDFLSAPFDIEKAELLHSLGVNAFKIASGELTNAPLLEKVASWDRPIILSTGASYLSEVKRAVDPIEACAGGIALLHCSALYPPTFGDVNLKSMVTLEREFGCPVGFSDHTPGSPVPVAAVALGATIIEKHITFDRNLKGPDHPYATEVEEFKRMVEDIRRTEEALGDGVKRPSEGETVMRRIARKSIYARADIKKGAVIGEPMLKIVRQAVGLDPCELGSVCGRKAARDIKAHMPVTKEDII